MTTWFLGPEPTSWWRHESYQMTPEVVADWEVFKQLYWKRFIPYEYIDHKKQEFTHLKQGKMLANEYYRKFTDLSRYDPEVAANPVEMLRRFRLGTKEKWRFIATLTPCATYQEFYEVLLQIENSENMPCESEDEEEKNVNLRRDDKGKAQTSQGARKTHNFKRSGGSSSSSSGGLSSNMQMRGGRFTGGPRFQRQRYLSGSGEAAVDATLVDRWVIGLLNAFRIISKCPNSLPYHHLRQPSKLQDIVVMPRLDDEVLIIIRVTPLLIPHDNISTFRTLSIREVVCHINLIQPVDLNGTKGDSLSRVLIDCGATNSVISHTFAQVTQSYHTPLGYDLEFSMPRWDKCFVDRVYPGSPVMVKYVMPANLMPLDIMDFDVILGTDWLHYNRAKIDCYGKTITFHRPGLPEVTFVGEPSGVRHGVISAMNIWLM
ncbi:uncharacterized protein [Malus domestica]|uniref:uncharacterized protein n=1 Tax=Malus domestica TaxID=3750 RepID=UPI003974DF66